MGHIADPVIKTHCYKGEGFSSVHADPAAGFGCLCCICLIR